MAKKLTRRSFLECALAGGAAAGTANLTIMRDAFAQPSGPIVIGHHCDLTGVISSWGVWHDRCARAAVDIINQGGGIAGRKVELATEDTESNPASGARKLRNLIQRANAEFVIAFTKDACNESVTGRTIYRVTRLGTLLSVVIDRRAVLAHGSRAATLAAVR